MNELNDHQKKILEMVKAFSSRIVNGNIDELFEMDDVKVISKGMFAHGRYQDYVAAYGMEDAMRLAFCLGAAWEREVYESRNPDMENLLKDVNLESGENHE